MKKTILFTLLLTLLIACKEGPMGPQGPAGPPAKTFNFNLTFDPGETYESYGGITGFDNNDVLLVYAVYEVLGSTPYWVQLPFMTSSNGVNFVPEFSDQTGFLFINTTWANGASGSPWSSSTLISFKAVLISSEMILPDVNYSNYEEVAEVYNL